MFFVCYEYYFFLVLTPWLFIYCWIKVIMVAFSTLLT